MASALDAPGELVSELHLKLQLDIDLWYRRVRHLQAKYEPQHAWSQGLS